MRARNIARVAGAGAAALLTAMAALLPSTAASGASHTITVVADHLDNPRGVSIGTNGRVLVAEAGHGDPNGGKCANVIDPESGIASKECLGFTGAVTVVQNGHASRVLTKLPSVDDTSEFEGTGPAFAQDVPGGHIAVVMQGTTNSPPKSWQPWASSSFTDVLSDGNPQSSRNLGAYEKAHDPAHDGVASDPFGGWIDSTGRRGVFVDAGANDALLWKNGALSTLAVFPPQSEPDPNSAHGKVQQQSVPTSVVALPDGSFLIGELTGYPYVPGSARIWRVIPGHAPTVWKTGFTNIAGLARGPDGSIYVSEIVQHGLRNPNNDASGGLFRIAPNGTKSQIPVAGLKYAGGVAVASNGTIYITNCSVAPPNATSPCRGQLLRVS